MVMELYASGFNAWNQLQFGGSQEGEPYDLRQFEKVLSDEGIDIWRIGFSSTLVNTSSGSRLAGIPDELTKRIEINPKIYMNFAEAGNGKIAARLGLNGDKVREYKSWTDYPDRPAGEWEIGKIKQIVAGHTTFTALTTAGEVWTWGDERYQVCLGRDISSDGISNTASQPGLVTDLQSLPTGPITKIASGGYVTAALTAGQDLYLWGADEFLRLGRQPTPLDLGDVDVRDVAVGDGHVVIATLDGKVLITGKGENGQIGMGEGIEELVEWREVDLNLGSESKILQVAAGPRCSLLLVGTGSKLAPRSLV